MVGGKEEKERKWGKRKRKLIELDREGLSLKIGCRPFGAIRRE